MLKAMIEKIVELAAPKTFEVDGTVYASRELAYVQDKKCRPGCIEVTGLDSICKLVRNEVVHVGMRIFIQVKSKQVARCGNAVCPPLAYAMVWANSPEWHRGRIETMEQFHDAVAV